MDTENKLPNNDPDLILAQAIGNSLTMGSSFSEIDDTLLDQLIEYKDTELAGYTVSQSISNSIWKGIELETKKKPAKITPLFSRPSTFAWASAAVLLIAAFIGFYWITLQPQLELVAETGPDIEVIILDDGSEITMRPNSKLHRINNRLDERAYALEGEAFFDVVSNSEAPFSVDGEYGTVTVLGTRFNLSTWGEKSMVYLEEGRVSFSSNSNEESIILEPGQSSEIIDGSIQLITEAEPEEYTDWISNTIVFNASSPEEVVYEINQHFGVTINIDQLLNRAGIDGTLQLDSISQTLDDLGLVLGGTFRQISETNFEFISME